MLRGGEWRSLDATEVVPGDICEVKAGDKAGRWMGGVLVFFFVLKKCFIFVNMLKLFLF